MEHTDYIIADGLLEEVENSAYFIIYLDVESCTIKCKTGITKHPKLQVKPTQVVVDVGFGEQHNHVRMGISEPDVVTETYIRKKTARMHRHYNEIEILKSQQRYFQMHRN